MTAKHRDTTTRGVLVDAYAGVPAALPKPPAGVTYRVLFDRVGHRHDVPPLIARAVDATRLAEQIHTYVRPLISSPHVQVVVDLDDMRGFIHCGIRNGGTFVVEHEVLPPPVGAR